MSYKLFYHPDVLKHDLAGIPKNVKDMIRRAIEERLLSDPVAFGEPLRHRKLRVGDYRVIYRFSGNQIFVLKIGHRKEVYLKVFSRLAS